MPLLISKPWLSSSATPHKETQKFQNLEIHRFQQLEPRKCLAAEFREFGLNSEGKLAVAPLQQTPDVSFNSSRKAELIQWVNDNLSLVSSNQFTIPQEFLAGASTAPAASWLQDSKLPGQARRNLAMSTCTGCHQSETQNGVIHLSNRKAEESSQLSNFLRGDLAQREFEFKLLFMEMFCGQ